MDERVCITNEIRDLRSCVHKNRHTDFCDGFAYRWVDVPVSDREYVATLQPVTRSRRVERRGLDGRKLLEFVEETVECRGCLPALAEHGFLCWSCWEKVRDGVSIATDMITHLRSVERAQQVDNAGVRSGGGWVIPVPNTWRTADELIMLLGHPAPGFPFDAGVFEVDAITERYVDAMDVEAWVNTKAGAEAAVRFYRTMQHAMAQHPMAEYEHRVRNVRCYKCRQRTLVWKPPLMFDETHENPAGMVRVVCTNEKCGVELDQVMYQRLAVLEESATVARKKKAADAAAPSEEEAS